MYLWWWSLSWFSQYAGCLKTYILFWHHTIHKSQIHRTFRSYIWDFTGLQWAILCIILSSTAGWIQGKPIYLSHSTTFSSSTNKLIHYVPSLWLSRVRLNGLKLESCALKNFIALYRFRQGFKRFFSCCPFIQSQPDMLSRREAVTSRYSCSGSPDHRIVRNGMKCMAQL